MSEPTEMEKERRRRIQVCLWAYAYEVEDNPLVDDGTFDKVCREIDVKIDTNKPEIDAWFRKEFDPCTGSWIRSHPDYDGIRLLYHRLQYLRVMVEVHQKNLETTKE